MVDITNYLMGIISWFINQLTSLGGPILDVHGILRDFMELERDARGISADLPGCFNSYNWLINMVFWEWFYEIGFTISHRIHVWYIW